MSRPPFLFTTGVENSYPMLPGGRRIDQMEKCGHYARWEEEFAQVRELGLAALRYGPAYYRTHAAPDRYDWSSADEPMHRLRELGIETIAGLCHFGVPDWLDGLQDPAFPVHFAEYARGFARRYPWVRYYTPVNEIFICASFSGLRGWWNVCHRSDRAFVKAVRNMCMARELAVAAILSERRDAIIVQSESLEHFPGSTRCSSSAMTCIAWASTIWIARSARLASPTGSWWPSGEMQRPSRRRRRRKRCRSRRETPESARVEAGDAAEWRPCIVAGAARHAGCVLTCTARAADETCIRGERSSAPLWRKADESGVWAHP